jgi:hypothetical protein
VSLSITVAVLLPLLLLQSSDGVLMINANLWSPVGW